jgi:hypothetical protein
MPRALEVLDRTVRQLERGEVSPLDAIDTLLAEELTVRESRRIKTALVMARLTAVKTLAGFDFSFQPSLDRNRILTLAQLDFIDRNEVVHVVGPPGTGKSHLAVALGVEAVKPAAASTSRPSSTSSPRWPRPSAKDACANASAGSPAPRCSSSARSATCRSSKAAATCSSSWSTPATRKGR